MSGRWYRSTARVRCAVGVHCWNGYHDLGDEINVQPVSGYRKPRGWRDFRRCSWCGATCRAVRPDDRGSFFVWTKPRNRDYRPIQKRGGYQPNAAGPPPTIPPPKPGLTGSDGAVTPDDGGREQ